MGCDIHSYAEVREENRAWRQSDDVFPHDDYMRKYTGKKFGPHPFNWRSYGMFGFLADVRNYSFCPTIAEPRGIPEDVSPSVGKEADDWSADGHTHSWITLRELSEYDYDQVIWDRRVTRQISPNLWDGAQIANEGEGTHMTLRAFLGELFFRDLEILKSLGGKDDVRIVFWFDN